jgi:hypothetical protein
MFRRTLLAAALLCAAACGPSSTEPQHARAAGPARDGDPRTDTTTVQTDTTHRGGGTIGSGT